MNRDNFEVVSVMGPLGSGKTTTLNRLIENVPASDRYAVVVNDVGETNVDAQRIWDHPANRSENVIPLTAGCIGCSDITQFREVLSRVHDSGINMLFIEPTGIAPGSEIADVVQSSGFSMSVLTLVNARTVDRDMKWQVLPSQLDVADIVGITHIPDGNVEIMNTVLDRLPSLDEDVAVKLIHPDSADYFGILAQLRGLDRQLRVGRHAVRANCEHSHHDHDTCDSHNVSAKSYTLRGDVSLEMIRRLLMPYTQHETTPLIRAKGVVGKMRFDVVGDEWAAQPDDSGIQSMNVIFADHIPSRFVDAVRDVSQIGAAVHIAGNKKSIVKSVSDLPVEDRIEIIHERSKQYPQPIGHLHGEIIPDCEADEGYEIAFWGNNDDIPDDAKRLAMMSYIQFRLDGLHQLQHHGSQIANFEEKAPYWARRFGATLGYNIYFLSEYISADLLNHAGQQNPAKLLCEGLMALDHFVFDDSRAEEKPEFVSQIMQTALERGDVSLDEVLSLRDHVIKLCGENEQHSGRWATALDFVTDHV